MGWRCLAWQGRWTAVAKLLFYLHLLTLNKMQIDRPPSLSVLFSIYMTPFSTEKWVSGTRSGYSMCSSPSPAAARHLVPTCPPHAPPPQRGRLQAPVLCFQQGSSHWAACCWKNALSGLKGERRVARYKSELLSDKWAMKSVLTSLRCSQTRSLLSLALAQPREDRVACRVTRAWPRSHQTGSFWPHGVFLHSAGWKHRHLQKLLDLLLHKPWRHGSPQPYKNEFALPLLIVLPESEAVLQQYLPPPHSGSPGPRPQGMHVLTGHSVEATPHPPAHHPPTPGPSTDRPSGQTAC